MSGSWLEAVAARAQMDVGEAELRLRRWNITPDRVARQAPSLTIRRIAFQGEKSGEFKGPIDFSWSDLEPGIWAITSERNFAGKSSILEIILWCLRGTPKNLQDDLRNWISRVELDMMIGEQAYRVAFDNQDRIPRGKLTRVRADGVTETLSDFSSDDGFAATMSNFMMRTLDLDPIPTLQGQDGTKQVVEHGWAALSGALYFGGEHKQLLGDVMMGGLPARMLQMYVGLPWAYALMQIGTARKEIEQESDKATKAADRQNAEAAQARLRLDKELIKARAALAALPSEVASAETLKSLVEAVSTLAPVGTELQLKLAAAEVEATQLRALALADERAVRDLRENVVAEQYFNGLDPSCCPRCETRVTTDRVKRETIDFSCSLCSEPIPSDQLEDAGAAIQAADDAAQASRKAADHADELVKLLRSQSKANADTMAKAQTALDVAVKSTAFHQRREAELEVARLEGALRERQAPATKVEAHPDAALIKAAEYEAKSAYNEARGDILDALSGEICNLAQLMGMRTLQSVSLSSAAQLQLTKGNAPTSFSKVTPGERLRLRLATAIALLRVGKDRSLGRHPGLLIIDSPGSEEVNELDLDTLLGELQTIVGETPGLQMFLASANPASLVDRLGHERCRVSRGDAFLW